MTVAHFSRMPPTMICVLTPLLESIQAGDKVVWASPGVAGVVAHPGIARIAVYVGIGKGGRSDDITGLQGRRKWTAPRGLQQ
jgi:hypothetical protein